MTLQTLFERIRQHFPKIPYAQVQQDACDALEDFVEETKILRDVADLTTPTVTTYDLPADFVSVVKVTCYDAEGEEYADVTYRINVGDDTVTFYDNDGGVLSAMPGEITRVELQYRRNPVLPASPTAVIDLPHRFQNFILFRLLAGYHAAFEDGDPRRIPYYEKRCETLRIQALKQRNIEGDAEVVSSEQVEL